MKTFICNIYYTLYSQIFITLKLGGYLKTNIKELRNEAGLSQQKLGDLVGVTRQTINALENARYNPSLLLAYKITKILGKELIEDVFILDD